MGLLEGIRSLGRGIASIPRKLNEAQYSHATVMVPIGVDPDTGEEIKISEEELRSSGMYDPQSGQTVMPQQVRTGQSRFGHAMQNGIPRMLSAGVAAAAAPGDGTGGILAGIKGMQIGGQHLQKQDLLAYNMDRQRAQDEAIMRERDARTAENIAQAQLYRKRAEEEGKPKVAPEPNSYAQVLVRRLMNETDPAKRAAIEKELKELAKGSPAKDAVPTNYAQVLIHRLMKETDPLKKAELEKELKELNKPKTAAGSSTITWGNGPNGKEQGFMVRNDPATGVPTSIAVPGLVRDRKPVRGTGGGGEKPATKRDLMTIQRNKHNNLRKAKDAAQKEANDILGDRLGQNKSERVAAVWSRLAEVEKAIQAEFDEEMTIMTGKPPTPPVNPMAPRSRQLLQRDLPLGMQSMFPGVANEPWMNTNRAKSLVKK